MRMQMLLKKTGITYPSGMIKQNGKTFLSIQASFYFHKMDYHFGDKLTKQRMLVISIC